MVAEREMEGLSTREVLKVDKAVAEKINSLRDCCGGELCILELYGTTAAAASVSSHDATALSLLLPGVCCAAKT